MAAARSKKAFRSCVVVILVLSMLELVAQLYSTIQFPYLPEEYMSIALQVTFLVSMVGNVLCIFVGCIAILYSASLGLLCGVLFWVLFGLIVLALIVALFACICFIMMSGNSSSSNRDCDPCSNSGNQMCCLFGCCLLCSDNDRSGNIDPDCPECNPECAQPCPTVFAFTIVGIGFSSLAIPIYLFCSDRWATLAENDDTPFLMGLLIASSVTKIVLAILFIVCFELTTDCWNGGNDHDEEKGLLEKSVRDENDGDISMRSIKKISEVVE
jgi:hypothetical protein